MRRRTETDLAGARNRAQERAFTHLVNNFDAKTSIAIASRVELPLALRWEKQQNDTIKRGDRSKIAWISAEQMEEACRAFAKISPGESDEEGERHVFALLTAGFLPDQAWWSAIGLRREVEIWSRNWARMRAGNEFAAMRASNGHADR